VHAAGDSSPGNLPHDTIAVVLGVPDETALETVAKRLTLAQVPFVRVEEPDPPFNGQLVALGVVPGERGIVGKPLRGLRTIK